MMASEHAGQLSSSRLIRDDHGVKVLWRPYDKADSHPAGPWLQAAVFQNANQRLLDRFWLQGRICRGSHRAHWFFVLLDPKQIPKNVMHRVRFPLSTHRKMR